MKIRQKLLFITMVAGATLSASAALRYDLGVETSPTVTYNTATVTYNEAEQSWTVTCSENTGGDICPKVQFTALTEVLPAELRCLAFEYRSSAIIDNNLFVMEKAGKRGVDQRKESLRPHFSKTDSEWRTFRVYVGAYRDDTYNWLGNKTKQFQVLWLRGLPVGATFEIRNIRYEPNEAPYRDITLSTTGATLIEAEDFNASADASASQSRYWKEKHARETYVNPVAPRFPIYTWGGCDYMGTNVEEAVTRLQRQMGEIWDCGFTIAQGSAYPGVDMAYLFDGKEINGYYIDLAKYAGDLKLLCNSGLGNWGECETWVNRRKDSPRLAGWFIRDEPFREHIEEMRAKVDRVRYYDPNPNHLLYGNLHAVATDPMALGEYPYYEDFVEHYMRATGISFVSNDIYPLHRVIATGERYMMPQFFWNLEVLAKLAKYYGVPFWAFGRSGSEGGNGEWESPDPTDGELRVQIFSNLAYGAQGIQYYTYKQGQTELNAPINWAHEKTYLWDVVKGINTEIHAQTWVFLGSELLRAGHTNAETPMGCVRLTPDMLPEGISSVTSAGGEGVCVTVLQNGSNVFLMVVNPDIHNTQTVTINKSAACKRVLKDGTTVASAAGSETLTMETGDYAIFLVDETAAPVEHYISPEADYVEYRYDAPKVLVSTDSSMSGGHYLPGMGDPSWGVYSLPNVGGRVISRSQAIENWGSTFNYTIEVPEDMDIDIRVGHSVPWSEYGRVASMGAAPGYNYIVEDNAELNWPKEYAASMIMLLDGEELTPYSQPLRPAVPEVFSEDGAEFNAILADKSRWISTRENGQVSNVLHFWPKAGGDNDVTPVYNAEPDYANVHLTAGTHTLRVLSLCSPWNFDNLRITPYDASGIDSVATESTLKATGLNGAIAIETTGNFTVTTLAGVVVANGSGSAVVELNAGFYVVTTPAGQTAKVAVK